MALDPGAQVSAGTCSRSACRRPARRSTTAPSPNTCTGRASGSIAGRIRPPTRRAARRPGRPRRRTRAGHAVVRVARRVAACAARGPAGRGARGRAAPWPGRARWGHLARRAPGAAARTGAAHRAAVRVVHRRAGCLAPPRLAARCARRRASGAPDRDVVGQPEGVISATAARPISPRRAAASASRCRSCQSRASPPCRGARADCHGSRRRPARRCGRSRTAASRT